jgi:hypothetical protein
MLLPLILRTNLLSNPNGNAIAIVDSQHPFHLNIAPTTSTPACLNKFNPNGTLVPYTQEEKSTINAKFARVKNFFKTWKNIYQA